MSKTITTKTPEITASTPEHKWSHTGWLTALEAIETIESKYFSKDNILAENNSAASLYKQTNKKIHIILTYTSCWMRHPQVIQAHPLLKPSLPSTLGLAAQSLNTSRFESLGD